MTVVTRDALRALAGQATPSDYAIVTVQGRAPSVPIRLAIIEAEKLETMTAAVPQLLDQIERLEGEIAKLRELAWYRHGCPFAALYGDDGEMQCGACLTDFKRAPVEDIVRVSGLVTIGTATAAPGEGDHRDGA